MKSQTTIAKVIQNSLFTRKQSKIPELLAWWYEWFRNQHVNTQNLSSFPMIRRITCVWRRAFDCIPCQKVSPASLCELHSREKDAKAKNLPVLSMNFREIQKSYPSSDRVWCFGCPFSNIVESYLIFLRLIRMHTINYWFWSHFYSSICTIAWKDSLAGMIEARTQYFIILFDIDFATSEASINI